MAVHRRVLAGRGGGLPALAALTLPLIIAGSAAASAEEIASRKAQIAVLERILAGTDSASRAERLHRLAELYYELAALIEEPGASAALKDAATACRQLLVDHPRFAARDATQLLLARVELRRGRTAAAREAVRDLAKERPRSPLRCAARLVAGDACTAAGKHGAAAAWYERTHRDAGCGAHRPQGGYRLGWSLIRHGETRRGATVLESLLEDRNVPRLLKERVLGDLALAWTADRPKPGAAKTLLAHGGAPLGWQLVEEMAARLLSQGRLEELFRFVDEALAEGASAATKARLWRLRLDAVARRGSPAQIDRELARLRTSSVARDPAVCSSAAEALLSVARRYRKDKAVVRELCQRVIAEFPQAQAAARAYRRLGDLALVDGDVAFAARSFGKAAALAEEPLRAEASYRQVYALQQLAGAVPGATGPAAKRAAERFIDVARAFVRGYPRHREADSVRLALAGQLLDRGRFAASLRFARALLASGRGSRRSDALQIALTSAERLGTHETSYSIALAELARCSAAAAEEPGLDRGDPPEKGPRGQASCRSYHREASRAALQRAMVLARAGDLLDARRWAHRAGDAAGSRQSRRRARWAEATLAARCGEIDAAQRIYRELAAEGGNAAQQHRASLAAAELAVATTRFAAAAEAYRTAAELAVSAPARLDLFALAARALLYDDRPAEAAELLARVARQARRVALPERWPLRFGALLSRVDAAGARRFYHRAAKALPPARGRLAAELLLAAAELAAPRARLHLARRAAVLAGPLRRRGRVSEIAARAAVAVARAAREVLSRRMLGGARHLAALERYADTLVPLVLLRHPRWSAAAGLQLAWAFGEMARSRDAGLDEPNAPDEPGAPLRARAVALRRELAAIARHPHGLNRYTLAAVRPRRVAPLRLRVHERGEEPGRPARAAIGRLVASGRSAAALWASERALALFGEDAAVRCARATAHALLDEPERAWQELATAVAHEPRAACARENLLALAQQRGDARLATALLARELEEPAMAEVAGIDGGKRR